MLISYTVAYDTETKLLSIDGKDVSRLNLNQAAERIASELKSRKTRIEVNAAISQAIKECGY